MANPRTPTGTDAPPAEVANVTPRELYPVSDIRFVMIEIGKLTTSVQRLVDDVNAQGVALDKRSTQSTSDIAKVCDRLTPLEGGLSALLAAKSAPWWKRIDPANAALAIIGIVTLLLALFLSDGRFEALGKRLDQADKHADQVEARSNRIEDRLGSKLDQIQSDLAVLKAARPASGK